MALRTPATGIAPCRCARPTICTQQRCSQLKSASISMRMGTDRTDGRKVLESMQAFRVEEYCWWQVGEYSFGTFMNHA